MVFATDALGCAFVSFLGVAAPKIESKESLEGDGAVPVVFFGAVFVVLFFIQIISYFPLPSLYHEVYGAKTIGWWCIMRLNTLITSFKVYGLCPHGSKSRHSLQSILAYHRGIPHSLYWFTQDPSVQGANSTLSLLVVLLHYCKKTQGCMQTDFFFN